MVERLDSRCVSGGSLQLLELIEEHPAELAYEMRARFGLSINDIGFSLTFRECLLLVNVLLRDPSSWLQAARHGWEYPVTREWIVASHTYDLLAAVNSGKGKKPKPYPTPFPNRNVTRVGKTDRSVDEVRAILDWMNPKET